ncbi:MAG: hypothetical protein GY788_07650 [bacterium]|nr:hypothetical protein [bacterium]
MDDARSEVHDGLEPSVPPKVVDWSPDDLLDLLDGQRPLWSSPLAVEPATFRGPDAGLSTRGRSAASLPLEGKVVPVEVFLSSRFGALTIDIAGPIEPAAGAVVRVVLPEPSAAVLEPEMITSGYLGFEAEWAHGLPAQIGLVMVEAPA